MADGARLAPRWIKQVAPWADVSLDASKLAVQPQEQADLVAKEWHDLWKVSTECQIDSGGVNNASVVPSPSPERPAWRLWFVQRAHCHWFRKLAPIPAPETRLWWCAASNCDDHDTRHKKLATALQCLQRLSHGAVTQCDGRMETYRALHKCAMGHIELGVRALPSPTGLGRQRTLASTRPGGSALQVGSPLLWDSSPPRRSLTSPRRSSTSSFPACAGWEWSTISRCATSGSWLVCTAGPGSTWWRAWRPRCCAREALRSWRVANVRPRWWSWPWLTRSTTPSRNCPRSLPLWSWTTRSSRRSARATKCRNSFSTQFTCSWSTRRRPRALWFLPRSWRSSPTMGGFALTCATTKCTRTLSARAQGIWDSTAPVAGSARVVAMRAKRFRVKMTFLKRLR